MSSHNCVWDEERGLCCLCGNQAPKARECTWMVTIEDDSGPSDWFVRATNSLEASHRGYEMFLAAAIQAGYEVSGELYITAIVKKERK